MFFGIDLKELLYFPFKDADARKYFLIGALISISAFIVPILPYFLLTGYAVQIARQVFKGESLRMVAWEDWGGMFKDGAMVFGVRIIYSLPILILILPMMVVSFALPFLASDSGNPAAEPIFAIFMAVMALTLCLVIPVSIASALFIPAAEMHVIEKNEFSAGFRIREWWAVFRANMGGFIAAFAIYYLVSMALAIIIQILGATLILACLIPILLPAVTFYIVLIMYVSIAQAYREGKAKLKAGENIPAAA
jgi:Protein of unknown function (DUF4013)